MIRSAALLRDEPWTHWLFEARAGSAEALGQLLEACHGYLLVVARAELRASLHAKFDAADLVQETFIEATRDFAAFRGVNGPQLLGWLRGILRHNLSDLTRRFETNCRCLSQEVPLGGPTADATGSVCEQLIAREQRRAVNAALERLPPAYREVLRLRYGECRSFAEIGATLQRSSEAARKLWARALERLRHDPQVRGYA